MRQIEDLTALIGRLVDSDGVHATAIPRLHLIRASRPTEPMHGVQQPALCIVVQGRKRMMLGDAIHHYDRTQYLVASIDLPIVGQVVEATADAPYLSVKIDLDPAQLGAIMLEAGIAPAAERGPPAGLTLTKMSPALLDAVQRLVALLETPGDIAMLAPLAEREILYRLMTGEQAPRLCQIATAGSRLQQVNRAIGWIKQHFDEAVSIETLAREARMSASALHQHFKAVTAMSPLQYQKQLRLQEARRLILSASHDAASAGFKVGYDSPSQFSREYRRLFGAPPLRDAARLRNAAGLEMAGA